MDTKDFARFYKMTRPAFFRFAFRLCRNDEAAEDLVQEACCQALASIDQLRKGESIKSWIFTIIRNRYRNEQRRNARVSFETLQGNSGDKHGLMADTRYAPDQAEYQRPYRELVERSLADIPEAQRAVIIARVVDGESYSTIARLAGTSIGTVRSRLHRARHRLRRSLATAAVCEGLLAAAEPVAFFKTAPSGTDSEEKVYLQI